MHLPKFPIIGLIAALACGGWAWSPAQALGQQAVDAEGYEVMTRGPVHEAFAGTVAYDSEPGIVVRNTPPELVEEVPPNHRPEGDHVTWIPGYWGWDEEQENFLWISGIWRSLPPGREWVPGYWNAVTGGYQWISGFWEDAAVTEVTYLPQPPRSLESGPSVASVSSEQIWIPGTWIWFETRYAWRAGYWTAPRENWNWTPAVYRWTPRGHVYVDGYWDYPVATRGVLFAPVYFRQPIYTRPGYFYRPATVININIFVNHLFLRPNYCHYYFGDYYASRYRDRGVYPSYHYHTGRRGYDPIYAYRRWENRHDRSWDRGQREYFEQRRDNESARPPRTWSELNSRPERDRRRGDFDLADRLDRVVADRGEGRPRFQAVAAADRERLVSQRQDVRKFGEERRGRETRATRPQDAAPAKDTRVARAETRRSPISSRPIQRTADRTPSNRETPPARLDGGETAARQAPRTRDDRGATRPGRLAAPQAPRRADPARNREEAPSRADQQVAPQPDRQVQPRARNREVAPPEQRTPTKPDRQVDPRPPVERLTAPDPARPAEPQQVTPPPRRTESAPRVAPTTPSRPQFQPQRQQLQPQRPQLQPQRSQAQPHRPQVQPQSQQAQPQRQQVQPQRQQTQRPSAPRAAPPQRSNPAPARPERRTDPAADQDRIRRTV